MRRTGRILGIIVVLGALYLTLQLLRTAGGGIATERAQEYSAKSAISSVGFVIRNESLVKNPAGGVLRYLLPDGARVAKNGAVAEVCGDSAQAGARERLDALEAQIAALRQVQKKQDGVAPDLNAMETQIFSGYLSSLRGLCAGEAAQTESELGDVLMLMNRKQIISGEAEDFSRRIAVLEQEAARLRSSAGNGRAITTDTAGYFIRQADGREAAVDFAKAPALTVKALAAAQKSAGTVAADVAGKIVRDYEWYIAAVIPKREVYRFSEGASVRLELPVSGVSELPVQVAALNRDSETGDAVAVFLCNYMNSALARVRSQPVAILCADHTGLRVPRRAVRVLGGKRGVYIVKGGVARFRKIEILYSASDYFVIRDGEEIALYDEIITKGKGLYDGKVVG